MNILRNQVSHIIIVDNASNEAGVDILKEVNSFSNVEVIRCDQNMGVGRAYNIGIEFAIKRSCEYVVLFDQDSEPSEHQVKILLNIYQRENLDGKIGVLGSSYYEIEPINNKLPNNIVDVTEEVMVITSGSLFKINILQKIGLYKEELFIDHVDTEHCMNIRKNGFKVLKTIAPLMKHSIGKKSTHRLFLKEISTSHHDANRRYFQARNLIILHRIYFKQEKIYFIHLWTSFLKTVAYVIIFEKDKTRKLISIMNGVSDAIKYKCMTTG